METKSADEKLKQAISALLGAWSLLQGVIETGWKELTFRKLDHLKEYFSPSLYQFQKMSNKQVEKVFAEQVFIQMTTRVMDEEELEDFLLAWMDEIFDSEPSENDFDHRKIATSLKKIQSDLKKSDDSFFKEVIEKCMAVRKAFRFQNGQENSESDEDSYEDVEEGEEDVKKFDHEAVFGSYKPKNEGKMKIEIEKEYLPKLEEEDDEDWQQA